MSMKILVTNDDGYRAEGIAYLRGAMAALGEVTVVAPDRNRSGAGNSLTLDVPLRLLESEPGVYYVGGTPTDCVHLAISGALDQEFELVASGINDGANLGDDVLYSGTVAGAIEGRFLGLPTLAISLCTTADGPRHFDTAARVAGMLMTALLKRPIAEAPLIFNVNVPDRAFADLAGFVSTRLGSRHRSEHVVPAQDPRGRQVYWIGPSGAGADAGAGTDFMAVAQGYVSVTPLMIDLTRHAALPMVSAWLRDLDKR
jgi:5'-nucleotidase